LAKKIKPVLPSLREKKRYLIFEIVSKKQIESFSEVSEIIWKSTKSFLGEIETAKSAIWVLAEKWNQKKQRGMIKVNNKYVDKLKTSMALVENYKKQKIILKSIGVSGIIKKAEKYIAM
jgi:ribonuclease P/MRP protein subunit POP5